MILLIDNYDSFSYNLVQLAGSINPDINVVRNDKITITDIEEMKPTHIIISPGPGYPKDAGICEEVIGYFKGKIPILGVCLGHQAICEVFGGEITHAKKLMHGKKSTVNIDNTCKIFEGMGKNLEVARYHSLIAKSETLPSELKIISTDDMGEIMAVKHRDYEIYGLQFHPESILTTDGEKLLENFLKITI